MLTISGRYNFTVCAAMRPNIQLAFQGGGAKLVEMLPVAMAFAEANRVSKIKITRVAGTSAGSICAALLASGADFEIARKFLILNGHSHLKMMAGPYANGFGHWHQKGRAIVSAYRGRSLYNGQAFRNFLTSLINTSSKTPSASSHEFADLRTGIKLFVHTSDLIQGQGRTIDNGSIIDAVINSCAIPIAFRGYIDLGVSPLVDGGICENLPVEHLLSDKLSSGPVFAIAPSARHFVIPQANSLQDYIMMLLGASIDNNVYRSRSLVGDDYIIDLKTNIGTLDFKKAIEFLGTESKPSKEFDKRLGEARRRIDEFCETRRSPLATVSSINGKVEAIDVMEGVKAIFDACLKNDSHRNISSTMIARADCLLPEGDYKADFITRQTRFIQGETSNKSYMSQAMLDKNGDFYATSWEIYNNTKNRVVPAKVIPSYDRTSRVNSLARDCVLLLDGNPDLVAQNDAMKVTASHFHPGAMRGLIPPKGSDFLSLTNTYTHAAEEVDLILQYPRSLAGRISVTRHADSSIDGNIIRDTEIRTRYGLMNTPEWECIGLRALNLPYGETFKALFTRD